jgi:hypothetical protein
MTVPGPRWLLPNAMMLVLAAPTLLGAGTALPTKPVSWTAGQPVPVKTAEGRASFDIPTTSANSRTLLIVSSLGQGAGPFSISLKSTAQIGTPRPLPQEPAPLLKIPEPPPAIDSPASLSLPLPEPASERVFHIMSREGDVTSASNYIAVRALLRAVGQKVAIYVDSNDVGVVTQNLLRDVAETLDQKILPAATHHWGPAHDVDHDGRFTIFVTSWLGRLGAGRLAADGFVRGADFDPELAVPFGNHCDMMYLNAALVPGPHLRTVLAHEYTHAVIFSRKALGRNGARAGSEEEGWLDEALAHLAEDLFAFSRSNLDYRVAAFLAAPERYRLVVTDYYAANLFRSHGHRGSAYLFLRWCADQYGPQLLSTLIRSPKHGIPSLEAATGARFEDLFRRWTIDLARSEFMVRPVGPAGRGVDDANGKNLTSGPRTTWCGPGDQHEWSSAGTAPHFVVVGGAPTGCMRVEISAPPQANLQVTAIPLPEDLPRMEISVQHLPQPNGAPAISFSVKELAGSPVQLHKLLWGPMVPSANPRSDGSATHELGLAQLAQSLGASSLGSHARLVSRPIALSTLLEKPGSTYFKLVGVDSSGRRVSAWTVLDGRLD